MTEAGPKILTNKTGRFFVVGDIHGCVRELMLMLDHLTGPCALTTEDQVTFIGDYIDRGPSTREVIETLVAFQRHFPDTIYLKGNHEEMMLQYLGIRAGNNGLMFLRNGGAQTFRSYGISDTASQSEAMSLLPPEHLDFLRNLERYVVSDKYVFVHAGLHPLKDLLLQSDDDIYWIRQEFIRNSHRFNKLVVFGHTPFQEVFLHLPYKIGIDTGLVYGNRLSMVELTSGRVYSIRAGKMQIEEKVLKL